MIAFVVSFAWPAAAQAAFSAPAQVAAPSLFHRSFVAAADATGRVSVATRAAGGVPRLIERPRGGGWADVPVVSSAVSGTGVAGRTALAAAGDGVLGVAWVIVRGDTSSIEVAVREPGGTLSAAIEIAGAAARGVDDVAIAVNAAGDVLVAYRTGTLASHLGLQGSIAVAYRPAGRSSFIGPTVVDRVMSNAPVVALARDGTGIVTWTRGRPLGGHRRQTLMTLTIGTRGVAGAAEAIARRVLVERPVAVAGPRGAASIAYDVTNSDVLRRGEPYASSVRVLARQAGGTFASPRRVFGVPGVVYDLAFAADEQGRATLTWTDSAVNTSGRFGPARIRIAAGRVGRGLGRARVVGRPGNHNSVGSGVPVSITARNGYVALVWTTVVEGRPLEVAAGPWDERLTPRRVPASDWPESPPIAVVIAGDRRVSALWRDGNLWVSDGP